MPRPNLPRTYDGVKRYVKKMNDTRLGHRIANRRTYEEDQERKDQQWRDRQAVLVPARITDSGARRDKEQADKEKKEQAEKQQQEWSELYAKQREETQELAKKQVELTRAAKREADAASRAKQKKAQEENDNVLHMNEAAWGEANKELTQLDAELYELDVHHLIGLHGRRNLDVKIFLEYVADKYTLDIEPITEPLTALYEYALHTYRLSTSIPIATDVNNGATTSSSAEEQLDYTVDEIPLPNPPPVPVISNQGRTVTESVENITKKLHRPGYANTGHITKLMETPAKDPSCNSNHHNIRSAVIPDQPAKKPSVKERLGTPVPMRGKEQKEPDNWNDPAFHVAANNVITAHSLFRVSTDDAMAPLKRNFEKIYGEPLYPSLVPFGDYLTLPAKRIRGAQDPPPVEAPTIHERMRITDPEEGRKADFVTRIHALERVAPTIVTKRPMKQVIEQFLNNAMTIHIPPVEVDLYACGLVLSWLTFDQLNSHVKCHVDERCTDSLSAAFTEMASGWKVLLDTTCSKRVSNYLQMASFLCDQLIICFDKFRMEFFLDRVMPHILNMTRTETALLIISIISGWKLALPKSNSMRGQSVNNNQSSNTPLTPRVLKMLKNMRAYRVPNLWDNEPAQPEANV